MLWGPLFLVGAALGETAFAILFVIALAVALTYAFLLEGLYGYTPGKFLLGLVVVKSDGSDCTIGASILRNLLWIVDAFPTFNLVAVVAILLTDGQRVGDLVADTVVERRR